MRKYLSLGVLLIIMVFVVLGVVLFHDQQYNTVSIGIVAMSSLPFYYKYETRKPQAREIVILAIMISITVVSRTVFMMTPSFKPMSVFIILCGMVFGKESGFMCGSLSALISNFFFGQGPWTPFQMISWGVIGYLAGVLNKKQFLEKNTVALYIYAIVAAILFSMMMDIWTVMSLDQTFNMQRYIVVILSSVPIMGIYIVSNVIFIKVLKKTMLQILNRVKIKYGIL